MKKANILIIYINFIFIFLGEASITCNINNSSIDFGDVESYSNSVTTSGSVTVSCSNYSDIPQHVNYVIKFNVNNLRILKHNQYEIPYNLYYDSNFTQILGDGITNGKAIINSYILPPLSSKNDIFSIYGKLVVTPIMAAKHYLDTVIVTLDY